MNRFHLACFFFPLLLGFLHAPFIVLELDRYIDVVIQNGGRLSPSSPSSGGGLGSGSVSSVSSVTSSSCLLDEQQLTKIGDVAELLVRSILPTLSPFDLKNMKKRLPKEMEVSHSRSSILSLAAIFAHIWIHYTIGHFEKFTD